MNRRQTSAGTALNVFSVPSTNSISSNCPPAS